MFSRPATLRTLAIEDRPEYQHRLALMLQASQIRQGISLLIQSLPVVQQHPIHIHRTLAQINSHLMVISTTLRMGHRWTSTGPVEHQPVQVILADLCPRSWDHRRGTGTISIGYFHQVHNANLATTNFNPVLNNLISLLSPSQTFQIFRSHWLQITLRICKQKYRPQFYVLGGIVKIHCITIKA